MTAYDTTYNRNLAQSQRLYDYANIKNDAQQYNMGPTHQGGGMSGGMNCGMGRPFSDVMAGMGMSGGVRRGAELADMASPSGQFSVPSGRASREGSGMSGGRRLVKGSAEAKAYMASIRKKKGSGASGAGFFDDVLGGLSKVGQLAGQVLPVASQGYDLYKKVKGKGMSGGRKGHGAGVYGMPELLGRTTQVLEGRGGTDGFPSGFKDNKPLSMAGGRRGCGTSGGAVPLKQQLVGILDDRTLGSGMSGGDFWSDFGDGFMSVIKPVSQVVGAIAPFLGAGESGGNSHRLKLKSEMYGRSMTGSGNYGNECCDDDAIGGKRPRLVKGSAEAKAYMASIRKKKGKGMCGSGIMEPAVSAEVGQPRYSYGQMADTAGKSNVGSGGGQSGGRHKGRGMSGGALSQQGNMAMADAMGDIFAGMGRQVGCGYSGGNAGISSELSLSSAANPLAEAFLGGRKPSDVPRDEKLMLMKKALADYAMMKQFKKHLNARQGGGMSGGGKLMITHGAGMSGGDGLSNDEMDALVDRDFTGAGMSGGDFWSDLGDVGKNLLPLLPMLL